MSKVSLTKDEPRKDKHMLISEIIKEVGVPVSLLGYHYLKYAVEMIVEDISLINSITKIVYPKIAKRFNTTDSRVERAIRNAIETGWSRGNQNIQNKLFGYTIDSNKGKPTNCEFIVTVADYINMLKVEAME